MALTDKDTKAIVAAAKKEPHTIQALSKIIKRAWVTTDSYVQQIKKQTGLINIKTFRKGTQGALKIVYYNYTASMQTDDIKEDLLQQIKSGRYKIDFDFMEIFQFVPEKKKTFIY